MIDEDMQGVFLAGKLLGSSRIARTLAVAAAALAMLSATLVGVSAPADATATSTPSAVVAPKLTATSALSGSSFQPGYIISDYLFYQTDAMTQAQIQTFLDAECPTHNCIDNVKTTSATRAASNMCPTAYVGAASETTAAIIYKVEQSCGISAKVILVTLQKEQGLVTRQNPSAPALREAMGYGCPDTAPCASQYYGLFNQIYDASSQFKRYGLRTSDNVSFRTKYQIGVPYPIAKSPNATCKTITVTVQDMATTALYYYTPYTPDPAALANLGGTGDACSSYGNRNFWVYWNNWFGDPLEGEGADKISATYTADGGSGGVLGASVGSSTCSPTSTSCSQVYANGVIYWTKTGGALTVDGVIYPVYSAAGGLTGALGVPTRNYAAIPEPVNGNGGGQLFANGSIYTSTAGTFVVSGGIRTEYWNQLSTAGKLGWPAAAAACTGSVCSQVFQGGLVVSSSATSAFSILGAYQTEYTADGGLTGVLGRPLGEQVAISAGAHAAGSVQLFSGGSIYSSPAGTFTLRGAIRTEYSAQKASAGKLGWPTAEQACAAGVCSQAFQDGSIVAPTSSTAFSVVGIYQTEYTAQGGLAGVLGHPLREQAAIAASAHPAGSGQLFSGGSIYSSSAGIFTVRGAIRTEYWAQKSNAGKLGWPTAEQVCTGGLCSQAFQGGLIVSSTATTAFAVLGGYATLYKAEGGLAGVLGHPLREQAAIPASAHPAGSGQLFSGGSIYSSSAGTFAVLGAIRTKYWAQKSNAGKLGWPTAEQVCSGAACTQHFQGGTLSN
ncbi:MAG TPA: hypothetical protein VHX87_09395 [Galbitalea sp.]|nr:hypothetical protein [Galbitalea sp.]